MYNPNLLRFFHVTQHRIILSQVTAEIKIETTKKYKNLPEFVSSGVRPLYVSTVYVYMCYTSLRVCRNISARIKQLFRSLNAVCVRICLYRKSERNEEPQNTRTLPQGATDAIALICCETSFNVGSVLFGWHLLNSLYDGYA